MTDRRSRRAAEPITGEAADASERRKGAPEDWWAWWTQGGENEIRCILMTAWDPVGIGDVPEAWDEYDNYLDGVALRLREAEDAQDGAQRVAECLHHVERDFMGLAAGLGPRSVDLGSKLAAWHEWSFVRGGRPPKEWLDRG